MPRGGKRRGAGRPRKNNLTVVSAGKVASVPPPKQTEPAPQPPVELSREARAVWERLAPLAALEGTLVPGTGADFADTCQLAVDHAKARDVVAAAVLGSDEWHKASRIYLAYGEKLTMKYRAFRLSPNGLPMVPAEKPEKPKSALEALKARRANLHAVR